MNTYVDMTNIGYHIREAQIEEDGSLSRIMLSNPKIKSIEVHPPQGEGDQWFLRVGYITRDYVDFFKIISIDWEQGVEQ